MFNAVPPVTANGVPATPIAPAVELYITPSVVIAKSRVPVAVTPLAVTGVARPPN